jgi:hypothetical protein
MPVWPSPMSYEHRRIAPNVPRVPIRLHSSPSRISRGRLARKDPGEMCPHGLVRMIRYIIPQLTSRFPLFLAYEIHVVWHLCSCPGEPIFYQRGAYSLPNTCHCDKGRLPIFFSNVKQWEEFNTKSKQNSGFDLRCEMRCEMRCDELRTTLSMFDRLPNAFLLPKLKPAHLDIDLFLEG